jgi:hypothetical protein
LVRSQLNARTLGGTHYLGRAHLSQTYQRRYWGLVFRFARKERVAGVLVGTLFPKLPRTQLVTRTRAALNLIAEFDSRQLDRLRRLTAGIFIFDDTGPLGAWMRAPRLIRLNEAYVAAPATTDAEIAATIVHETTHAWLEARGFAYRAERRRRIEAICYRAEASFVRRLPEGSVLASEYEECRARVLAESDDHWSDAAFYEKNMARARALGVPEWLLAWSARRRKRRAA